MGSFAGVSSPACWTHEANLPMFRQSRSGGGASGAHASPRHNVATTCSYKHPGKGRGGLPRSYHPIKNVAVFRHTSLYASVCDTHANTRTVAHTHTHTQPLQRSFCHAHHAMAGPSGLFRHRDSMFEDFVLFGGDLLRDISQRFRCTPEQAKLKFCKLEKEPWFAPFEVYFEHVQEGVETANGVKAVRIPPHAVVYVALWAVRAVGIRGCGHMGP